MNKFSPPAHPPQIPRGRIGPYYVRTRRHVAHEGALHLVVNFCDNLLVCDCEVRAGGPVRKNECSLPSCVS